MGWTRRFFPLFCALALSGVSARAAVLIHEYALRGTLADNQGGPALSAIGGQITSLGYVFAANQGLTLASPLLSPASFSLELSFRYDSTVGLTKIVDFQQLTNDAGLYQRDGRLTFFPFVTSGGLDFAPGANVHLVFTRDAETNTITGYINGQLRFSMGDLALRSLFPRTNNQLNFFVDDRVTGNQAASGTLNYLRVFNGVLTQSDVNRLYAGGPPLSIPEPPVAALLLVGSGALFLGRLRRKSRR